MVESLEDLFPGLRGTPYQITSPKTDAYNCIAWAAGDTQNWWWPDADIEDTWPESVPRTETLTSFQEAFAVLGYAVCPSDELEAGWEKIALFADPEGFPTHAARQLPDGRWTSKLGKLEDIEHALRDLEGAEYGRVVLLVRRPLPERESDQSRPEGSPEPER